MYFFGPPIHDNISLSYMFLDLQDPMKSFRFIRRGKAQTFKKKSDLDSDGESDADEIASDMDNVEEMRTWLSTTSAKSQFIPNQELVRKYLPPGNVMELYEEYKATQQMLGGHHVSYLVTYLFRFLIPKKHLQ